MTEAQTTTPQPTGGEAISLKRVLVGFDGSDGGRDALELAHVVGSATGADMSVATVIPYGPLPIPYAILDEEEEREAMPLFEEARERLAGLDVQTRAFGGGSPGMVLTTCAEREDTDLLVTGSRRYGPVSRVLLGSVSTELVHQAPCPVMVVPRP